MAVQLPEGMGAGEVRAAVRDRYGQVAAAPDARFNFPVGRAFAEAVGYPAALLDSLPPAGAEAFAGMGCPAPAARLVLSRVLLFVTLKPVADGRAAGGHEAERSG